MVARPKNPFKVSKVAAQVLGTPPSGSVKESPSKDNLKFIRESKSTAEKVPVPEAVTAPVTSKATEGVVVPIPTLPAESTIRMLPSPSA